MKARIRRLEGMLIAILPVLILIVDARRWS